ncbi:hypothetical protein CANARDRAFT_27499 [[Candida] arabinofermentans NRRL YB-2248]|uniref:Uncharacterized protein n=1 Tax=[Candida] arabinofermentans NRRL YB-2248 TaxID=983967 RepID=A0A1E4T3B5_9ASCO|nr:hypothetical protein CANARDRAFT_27499 [[Candida] arabinofermentans NRRL YB-2248]
MTSIALNLLDQRLDQNDAYNFSDQRDVIDHLKSQYDASTKPESQKQQTQHGLNDLQLLSSVAFNKQLDNLIQNRNNLLFSFSDKFDQLDADTLRLLLERSMTDYHVDNKNQNLKILQIDEYDELRKTILELKSRKTTILNGLRKGLKSVDELIEVDSKLSTFEKQLNDHYILTSQLGYIQDIELSASSSTSSRLNKDIASSEIERSLDDLVSTVMSLSIQSGVQLPNPDPATMGNLHGRIDWCSNCISSLVEGVRNGSSPTHSQPASATVERFVDAGEKKKDENEKVDLKTALHDLQFAHNYLTRQYEDERDQYSHQLSQLRLQLEESKELLNESNMELSRSTNQTINLQMKITELQSELLKKDQAALRLIQENNLLKVDHLGQQPTSSAKSNSSDSPPTTPRTSFGSPEAYSTTGKSSNIPTSPTRNNVSASILRMEFKKLVNSINSRFEKELEVQRAEKERLQDLLRLYEGNSNNPPVTDNAITPPISSSL